MVQDSGSDQSTLVGRRSVRISTVSDAPKVSSRRRSRRAVRFWRTWRWELVALVAVGAFVLGFIGYSHVYAKSGFLVPSSGGGASHLGWADRLYYTVLLFKFSTAVGPPYSSSLEIARWLAPLTTAYAGFRVIAEIFSDRWARFKSNHLFRGHVVVCGLGLSGLRIASAEWNLPVVAIEKEPSSNDIEACREHGLVLLKGEATDPVVLGKAGLDRAKYVFVVCGDDGTNAEVALLAQDLAGERHPPLECFVQVDDERACGLLEKASLADPTRRSTKFEFFNTYRSGPRALLNSHASFLSDPDGGPTRLIVVGSSRLGSNLIAEAARRWSLQSHSGEKLTCVVVDPNAAEQCEELRARFPDLAASCELVPCRSDPSDPDGPDLGLTDIGTHPVQSVAFVCLDDDAAGLRATIRVRDAFPQRIPIVLCTTGHSDVARLLSLAGSGRPLNVIGFGLLDQVCHPHVLLNGDRELIAQAIHSEFVRNELLGGRDKNDISMQPWDLLPESLRESNRDQAADIGRKLDEAALDLVVTSRWGPAEFTFEKPDLEKLSREEHDRWMQTLTAEGWRVSSTKDVERKGHPLLVPWESLSEESKEKDRNAVRAIPAMLASSGYAIVRRDRHESPTSPSAEEPSLPKDVREHTVQAPRASKQ